MVGRCTLGAWQSTDRLRGSYGQSIGTSFMFTKLMEEAWRDCAC